MTPPLPSPGPLGPIAELWHYARRHQAWWLLPMLAVLLLFGIFMAVAELVPAVSPLVYTLF